jgi:serine/threonine-protein kinase ATR
MNMYTVRAFSKAIMHGSKFVYQTVPRLLTIWLDLGENKVTAQHETFKKMTDNIAKSFRDAPVYKVFISNASFSFRGLPKIEVVHCFPSNRISC